MSRQLRSGNSHVTSLKTVKRSYKKPIKTATIVQATEAVTVLIDTVRLQIKEKLL